MEGWVGPGAGLDAVTKQIIIIMIIMIIIIIIIIIIIWKRVFTNTVAVMCRVSL
jgi:hypothetical protein